MKTTLFAIFTLFSSALWAQGAPVGAQIINVTTGGPGCRGATATAVLSPDSRELSILFDNFILEADGSNVNPGNLRAETSCTAQIEFRIPRGWQMALVAVDYRGFAAIPARAVGYQRFLYQAPNMPIVSMREATFRGPLNNNYSFTAQQKPGRSAWTPCGLSDFRLPMTAVLGVYYSQRGYYPAAQMALDSQDLSMSQGFQVAWQRCM
jgi:hypothetical protein